MDSEFDRVAAALVLVLVAVGGNLLENSLFSESWYRVANLKPRLLSHAQIHKHTYRGKDWYVLQNHSTGFFHRFSPEAYSIIGQMDGRHTLQEIWEKACASLGDDMPTQDEVIGLLSQLHQAEVLLTDIPPDIADLLWRHIRFQRSRWLNYLMSPMAVRFPLLDPDRFLRSTQAVVSPLFSWVGGLLWCLVVSTAFILACIHWSDLTSNLADRVLALENLLLLGFVYPIVKALHEFSHAYFVKRWGGEVHEMGIMLLVLMPIPYVDASSSSAFQDKSKRMLVGAAGILIEVFLAALAMFAWVNLEPGILRALAFNVMLIAGVSTILFNGNPLLRFDAYYILSDFLEIPNLGSRSNAYIAYLLKRYLLRIEDVHSPCSAPGEAPWLGFYAVASFIYRIFISVRIALFIAGKFFIVGMLLAGWALFSMLILPFFKVVHYLFSDQLMKRKRKLILVISGGVAVLMAVILFVIPLPSYTMAEGVVWVHEQSQVHAGADGFVEKVVTSPGESVQKGDPLVVCHNLELQTEVKVLEARLREYGVRLRQSLLNDRTETEILKDEVKQIKAELKRNQERNEELVIRSPEDGTFILAQAQNLPGRFLMRGSPLGYVIDPFHVTVRLVVHQSEVDRIRNNTRKVEVRLAGEVDRKLPAFVERQVPLASSEMPSLALSLEGGGEIALDPREHENPRAFEKLFQFDILLPGVVLGRIGERAFVRFDHHPEPLAIRWYRNIRRVLLKKFDV